MTDFPLHEFDPDGEALIEPHFRMQDHPVRQKMPSVTVLCFFREVVERIVQEREAELIWNHNGESGMRKLYAIEHEGQRVAITHAPMGAPSAVVLMEEAIAAGTKTMIAVGGAGVLDAALAVGHPILVQSAVRDEGVSWHYAPPSRDISADADVLAQIQRYFDSREIEYVTGKVWTTSAVFRETRAKIAARKAEGCIAVEMEAAALIAVARFRGVPFGQILYAGDDVSGAQWDHRSWRDQPDVRERLFWLAVDTALAISSEAFRV